MSRLRTLLLMVLALLQSGCAIYSSEMRDSFTLMEQGRYEQAREAMQAQLHPEGNDRLIYYMELGVLSYLAGDYNQAIELLNRAEVIGDELYTKRISEMLLAAMTNPRSAPYAGKAYELLYIHYYKLLAFLALASETDFPGPYLDGARVEARKIDLRLNTLAAEQGSYAEAKDEKEGLFQGLIGFFGQIVGESQIGSGRIYRNDAYLRYITGVVYELRGEFSEARIAYQKAAEIYEAGFAKQYFLDQKMVERAWFDTLRMMRRVGGFATEIEQFGRENLGEGYQERLDSDSAEGQLLVLQHLGRVPQREQLEMMLYKTPASNDLILRPVLSGDRQERQAELGWFFTLYSGHSLLESIYNYRQGNIYGVMDGLISKRIPTSVVGSWMRSLGIADVMARGPIRVTVPYYRPLEPRFSASRLRIDGEARGELIQAESLADIALQQQFVDAGEDLRDALAREIMKVKLSSDISRNTSGELSLAFSLLGRFASIVTSAAETRNWLALPFAIRIQRLTLPAGTHRLELETKSKSGGLYNRTVREVTVDSDRLTLWPVRTFHCPGGHCVEAVAEKHEEQQRDE